MAVKLAALLGLLPTITAWSATVSEVVPKTPGFARESAVAVPNGLILTDIVSMTGVGSIKKFNFDGTAATSFAPVANLTGLKGLVVNQAGTKLYAALANVVKEYTLTDSGATEARTFNTSANDVSVPAGGCMDAEEQYLYVTQQGWTFMNSMKDSANKNALLQVKLSDGSIKVLFQDLANHSPNGCQVVGDKVVMVHMAHGVSFWDLTLKQSLWQAWSQPVKDAVTTSTAQGKAGDGIVVVGETVYASVWTLNAGVINGTVFKCNITSPACDVYATVECADMKLDTKSNPAMPRLLCPSRNMQGGLLRGIDLPPAPTTTRTPTTTGEAIASNSACSMGTSATYALLALALRWG